MMTSKPIVDPNLGVFVQKVAEAVKEGWTVDPQHPALLLGYLYECHVFRDENIVDEVKPSRAEILANARAAKKAKSGAQTETPAEE